MQKEGDYRGSILINSKNNLSEIEQINWLSIYQESAEIRKIVTAIVLSPLDGVYYICMKNLNVDVDNWPEMQKQDRVFLTPE